MKRSIFLAFLLTLFFHCHVWAATATEKHWNCDPTLYSDNMTVIGVVVIDEAEQANTSLEVGAFCGSECRGSEMVRYFPQVERYLVFLTVYGEDNDAISFKLFDHDAGEEVDTYIEDLTFGMNAMYGTPTDPYEFNFISLYSATLSVNPEGAGTVTGAGHYFANETVTLSATPNAGWRFVNWTENDVVVSNEPSFQLVIDGKRTLVANFEMIMHHVDLAVNFAVCGTVSGAGDYQEGTQATVSATPNEGYEFFRWTRDGAAVSTNPSYTFTVTEPVSLLAEFKLQVVDTAAAMCDGFVWYGQTYTSSGTYQHTFTSYLGLDSIVALHLTIYPSYQYNEYQTACDEFTWRETTYTESGDYTVPFQTIHGCDSIYTLHLTVNTTRPLGNFTYMTPANNYINRYTDAEFYWDGVVNADKYDFYFWEEGNDRPASPTIANSSSVTAQRSGLEHGVTYYWCVVAKNECVEVESAVRTFECQLTPAMTVLPQSGLDFGEVEVGQSLTKNISVSGTALPEEISYTFLENEYGADAGFFTVTPASNWNATKGGTLQVTFAPVASQLYYNSALRIASGTFVDTVYMTGSMANRYVFTTSVDGDLFTANDSILITGHVEDVLGNAVSGLDVDVYLLVWGMRTTLRATSDEDGDYRVKYGPRSSESGYYQVGSCERNKNATAVHDAFDIPGMSRTTNSFIIWDIYQDETVTGSIPIRNRSRIPLGNIQVVPVTVPDGLEASFSSFSLDALETGELQYTYTGTEITTNNSYSEAVFQLVSDDGVALNLTCYYLCRQRRGDLEVYPPSVTASMKRYGQTVLSFQVTNNGNAETGIITIDLPDVSWMRVMGSDTLPSLAVGDSLSFSLMLAPDENVPLGPNTGNFAVNCANGNGFSVPYNLEATSDSTGVLVVDVTDDYTYNTDDRLGPHLAGASVTVVGYYSLETVAHGYSDEQGIFQVDDLPEGYYYLTVRADDHKDYNQGVIHIEGGKTNNQPIYLQFEAITWSWEVVPTEVEDEYGLVLKSEIKTNVPVPVVLIEGPGYFDELDYGDTLRYSMTVSNRGLVDACDTHITIEENYDDYVFTPMFDVIDTLHPQEVVVVPCIMTRVSGADGAKVDRDPCSVGFDKSLSWYRCNQQLKCVEHQTQFTIGAPYACSSVVSSPLAPQTNANNPTNSSNPNPDNPGSVTPPVPSGMQNNSYQSQHNATPEIATTSQDCVPCWQSLHLPTRGAEGNLLDLDVDLQELIRQSRSCTSVPDDLSCPETSAPVVEWPLWSQTGDLAKIDPELQELMHQSRDGNERFRVIIEMKEQYNNVGLDRATAMMTRAQRRDFVVEELKRFSENSQADVKRYLKTQSTRGGMNVLHHFWIFNGICCEATASCIDELSMRSDVRYVSLDKEMDMDDPIERSGNDEVNPPEGVQWHVSRIQADQVWNGEEWENEYHGYTGRGVVVAIIDSGVNYKHNDIKDKMWVWYYDENQKPVYGWDFYDDDYDPMDDDGHGSHVAGIVAGRGSTYQTGVAPDATIMAVKVAHGDEGPLGLLLNGVQFAVDHGADVLNISRGVPLGGISLFRDLFISVNLAGVVAVCTAGNEGNKYADNKVDLLHPVPFNIDAPGNCPPPWLHPDQIPSGDPEYENNYRPSAVICVGATTINEDNTLASYSSFGPVTWTEGDLIGETYLDFPLSEGGLIRPDVVAPGGEKNSNGNGVLDKVCSLSHDGPSEYCWKQGTSMAAPCVAGVIALMLEANPNLTPAKIDSILETTATHIPWGDETGKNNHYGSGLVNAKAAVKATLALNAVMPQRYHITADRSPFSVCAKVEGCGYYEANETCELHASPAECFLRWERDGEVVEGAGADYSFNVEEDANFVAFFSTDECRHIIIRSNPEGATKFFGENDCMLGSTVEFRITANEGYSFINITKDGIEVSTDPNYSFTVTEDATYIANFKRNCTITTSVFPEAAGIVSEGGSFWTGETCTVTAVPNPGYVFRGWYIGTPPFVTIPFSRQNECAYSVHYKDVALTAWFTPISQIGNNILTLQDLGLDASTLNAYMDAIEHCTLGNNRDSNEAENLLAQLEQCRQFYQSILNVNTNLFQEEEWMEEENIAEFLDNFNALMDPEDQTFSPQATQQLIEMSEFSNVDASIVQSFVDRWNRSVQYWSEGIYTLADLPEGYDPAFVQRDSTLLQPAEAACEYATDNGFNNYADLYYTTLSDCNDLVREHQNDVCAKVSIQFNQTMAMTREAFEGTLRIANGHVTDPMQDIAVNIVIKNEEGVDCTDLFQINTTSMSQITGIDGTGSLDAQKEGVVQFMMIPTIEAAPSAPVVYSFGGSFTFLDPFSGEEMTYQLFPVSLTVNPGPNLYIDYFVQRNIISDDPLTEDVVEPMEEAEIAMMIRNLGAGDANNVYLESSQPKIVQNENNLLIDFELSGSAMNGERRPLAMTHIPFGTIASHTNGIAEWYYTSTLMGRVINSTAQVIHNNSYGNPRLSLVSAVNTHELIKGITAYGDLDDGINDFLVNEITDLDHKPDRLYFSHGDTTNVIQAESLEALDTVTYTNSTIVVQLYPHAAGWNYGTVEDPGRGRCALLSCTRSDGQEIPLNNVWITHVTIPHDDSPIHENILHLVDTLSTDEMATYTLVYEALPCCETTEQDMELAEGWNWWSTYIDLTDEGLARLEDGLGSNGEIVKSMNQFVSCQDGDWYGTLSALNNQNMYMIRVKADQTVHLSGVKVDPAQLPIELVSNWNWIGYPLATAQSIENALAQLEPDDGDILKSIGSFTTFDSEYGGWFGGLRRLAPGEGYMYKAKQSQSFYYSEGRRYASEGTDIPLYWKANAHAYADNMSVVAAVFLDGNELRSDGYEVAAFSDGQCLGTTRLLHHGLRDRYYALIPVSGSAGMTVSFRLYKVGDSEFQSEALETFGFAVNGVIGTLNEPLTLHFNSTSGLNEERCVLQLFPNPVERGGEVYLNLPCEEGKKRVEIYSVLDVLVGTQEIQGSSFRLGKSLAAGTYLIRVFVGTDRLYYGKLIVH